MERGHPTLGKEAQLPFSETGEKITWHRQAAGPMLAPVLNTETINGYSPPPLPPKKKNRVLVENDVVSAVTTFFLHRS